MNLTATNDDTTVIRRARKDHDCILLCGQTIRAGDEYAEYVVMAEGAYANGPRYCATCAVTEGLAVAVESANAR